MKGYEMIHRICRDLYRLRQALAVLFLYGLIAQFAFHTVCPFAVFTGHPCPACGMSRAVLLFFTRNFRLSFSLHSLALFWPLFLLYLGYFRYLKGRSAPFVRTLTVILCLTTLAYYLYRLDAGTLPEVPGPGIFFLVSNSGL